MNDELKAMYDEMQKLMEEMDPEMMEEMQEQLESMEVDQESLEKELDRALEQFKQLEYEVNLEEALDDLKDSQKNKRLWQIKQPMNHHPMTAFLLNKIPSIKPSRASRTT
jgi:uncharacterized protein YaaN involved in tellurite resistance